MAMFAAIPAWAAYAAAAGAAVYAGYEANQNSKYNAKVADINSKIAGQRSNAAEESMRRTIGLRLGEQRAGAAQSGFESSTGSFGALQVQSVQNAELDALTSRYTGELESISFKNQAAGLRAQGKAAQTQGFVNAAGSLFAGGSSYGSSTKIPTGSTYSYNGGTGFSNAAGISGGR